MKKIVLFCILGLMIFSCKKDKTGEPSTFFDTPWTLSYIQNISTKVAFNFPDDAGKKITITFSGGLVSFDGICNTGTGNFTTAALDSSLGTLTVTDLSSTKINCTYVEWEGYLINNLGKAYKYLITGNRMDITTTGDYNLFFVNE